MSNEQLKHIFDDSVCLTRRQMKDYVEGTMTNEESHAVELHLNSCPFCSEATEGLFEQKEGRALETLMELDTNFLKDHFSLHHPQIHLNSLAAAQPVAAQYPHKKRKSQPLWRNISIAAALALGLGIFWLNKYSNQTGPINQTVAQQTETAPPASTINRRDMALADNTPAAKPQSTEPGQPVNNGGDPKAPQTLLLADKQEAKESKPAPPAEAVKAVEDSSPRKKEEEFVAANAFKADAAPAPKPAAASEQIEKMPTRTTDGVAATSSGVYAGSDRLKVAGARSEGTLYMVDGVQTRGKVGKNKVAEDHLSTGDGFYNERKYNQALNAYKKELNSDDKGRRQKAGLMAARCYLALDQKTEAKKLLNDMVQNGSGSAKREAKRLLAELGEE